MAAGKKIILLATGGTIAGVGEPGKTAGYVPGTLAAQDLVMNIPGIRDVAELEVYQICNVNSDDITGSIWITLAARINEMAEDPSVDGFVITHGTDTLEETAYFLNLTVKTHKSVVITGSMRPSSGLSPDGPINLYDAICVASSDMAKGKGVLAVFSGCIYSARFVIKSSTYHIAAIGAGERGAMGVVRDGKVYIYGFPVKAHTLSTEFDLKNIRELPGVSVLYFSVDADPALITFAASRAGGLVIAGAGAGEFSLAFKEEIEKLAVPVVISSRVNEGIIMPENLLCKNTVAANDLSPAKAAVLLRLALAHKVDRHRLQEIYDRY